MDNAEVIKILKKLRQCCINIGDDEGINILISEEKVNKALDIAIGIMRKQVKL